MRSVTSGFKSAIKEYGKTISAQVVVTVQESGVDVVHTYGAGDIVSIKLTNDANILGTNMRQCEIEMQGIDTIGTDRITSVKFGVTVGASVEYIDYGAFIVKEANYDDETGSLRLTCYDPMILSMVPYALNLDYTTPITLQDLAAAICANFGWTLTDSTFTNGTKTIAEELFADGTYTYRDALTQIAQCAGGVFAFLPDGNLHLIYPTDSEETIDPENLKTLHIGKHFGPVNSVALCRTPQEDNVYAQDGTPSAEDVCEIRIENNQIMNGNDRDTFLPGITSHLFGLEYDVCELDSYGFCYFDALDFIGIKRLDGTTYTMLLTNNSIEITQGLTESLNCAEPVQGETEYKYASKTDGELNRTILRVDKVSNEIVAAVSDVRDVQNEVTGLHEEVTHLSSLIINEEGVEIIVQRVVEQGVGSVTTGSGYTFNDDGLRITKSGQEMETLVDNTGMTVSRGSEEILTAKNDGVSAINLTARRYLIVGSHARFEDYDNGTDAQRTACFYIE